MIVYVVSADHSYTIKKYLKQWVSADQQDFIQTVFYEEAPWRWLHLPATYIFTDVERLSADEIAIASDYARALEARGFRVLNVPATVPSRRELQKRLFERGINPFRMWAADTFSQCRFPAFLRRANMHTGSIGGLISDQSQFVERLKSLPSPERNAEDLVLVEFCDTQDHLGRYQKYSAMRVGEILVPRHVFTSMAWMVKEPDIVDPAASQVEWDFVRTFPHRRALQEVFDIAGIDFGRVDYGLQDGELRVWEINTNPTLMPNRKNLAESRRELIEETNSLFLSAMRALVSGVEAPSPARRTEWSTIRARHTRVALYYRFRRKIFGRQRP